MIKNIQEEDVEIAELMYCSQATIECLFHDFDNLASFSPTEFGEIRLGQLPLLSSEYLLDTRFNDKKNMQLREGAGTIYCFGGRNFGKTLMVETLDIPLAMLFLEPEHCGFTSLDAMHIRGVLEKVCIGLSHHPFLSILDCQIKRSPNYTILTKSGYLLESVNMNLQGSEPGASFFQKHFKRLYLEEASFENDEIYKKRQDSVDEDGCVIRSAGMTNFTKYSPIGRIFYDEKKKPWVANLPQYINPKYDNKKHNEATKEHAGENSLTFRVFVKGEVVEEGISVFDMQRVKLNYNNEKPIKFFEINKDNFYNFENIIVVERMKQADKVYISADIGESAPSEIIIIFEVQNTYKYHYNITLYNLTDKEQFKIFKWLAEKLKANVISIDTSEGTGRAIFRSLEEIYPKENLVWVGFSEKIAIDFERDDKNNVIFSDGNPKYREEYVTEWSIKRLKDLFYEEGKIEISSDYKFDKQFNSVISMQSGSRVIFDCTNEDGDHLLSAFRVFAIAQWYNEFNSIKPISYKKFSKFGC